MIAYYFRVRDGRIALDYVKNFVLFWELALAEPGNMVEFEEEIDVMSWGIWYIYLELTLQKHQIIGDEKKIK